MQFSPTQFFILAIVLTSFELVHSASSPDGNRSDPPERHPFYPHWTESPGASSSTSRASPTHGSSNTRGLTAEMMKFHRAYDLDVKKMVFPSGKYWAQLGANGPWIKIIEFNPKIQDFLPVMSYDDFDVIDRIRINDWFSGIYDGREGRRVKLWKRDLNQYKVMTPDECARSRIYKRRIGEITPEPPERLTK